GSAAAARREARGAGGADDQGDPGEARRARQGRPAVPAAAAGGVPVADPQPQVEAGKRAAVGPGRCGEAERTAAGADEGAGREDRRAREGEPGGAAGVPEGADPAVQP